MTTYHIRRLACGTLFVANDVQIVTALLEIAGGGYTPSQTAQAMVWQDFLRRGETVRTSRYEIVAVQEQAA